MADATTARPRATSLLTRLLRAVLALFVLGGIFVAATAWLNGRQAAWESYDRLLLGAANDIAESIRVLDGQPVVDLPVSAFELLAQAPDDRVAYAVRGPDRALITGFPDLPAPRTDPRRAAGPSFYEAPMQGDEARYVEITRRFAERDFSGEVRVTVGQTSRARQAMTVALMLDALLPMALAGVALLLTSVIVIRSAVRPLGAIADDLAGRDPHDLTPMPTENVPQEIRVMLDAMNRFMARLDRQFDVMRHLISDTAHQLRTPVAAIRVQAETVLEEPDADLRTRATERLLRRTRSLGTLLDQMLSRAMVIHRTDATPRQALDLRGIALEIVDTRDHEVLAPEVEIELVIGEAEVMVLADEFSLVQAGKNLLTNALRHGAPPVRLGVEARGAEAWLWVEDAGPGIAPEKAALLDERFAARTGPSEESAGLGLSIVSAVAAAFGGRVEMDRAERFRIALVLPLMEEAP